MIGYTASAWNTTRKFHYKTVSPGGRAFTSSLAKSATNPARSWLLKRGCVCVCVGGTSFDAFDSFSVAKAPWEAYHRWPINDQRGGASERLTHWFMERTPWRWWHKPVGASVPYHWPTAVVMMIKLHVWPLDHWLPPAVIECAITNGLKSDNLMVTTVDTKMRAITSVDTGDVKYNTWSVIKSLPTVTLFKIIILTKSL